MTQPTQLYFAYGSNLNGDDFVARCGVENADVISRPQGVAYLPDHELAFNYHSKSRAGGALNIVSRSGQLVPGALFEVTDRAKKVIARKEGAPVWYQEKEVTVLTTDGRSHQAFTYEVAPAHIEDFVRPTNEYVEVVRQGLRRFGLGDRQLMAAAENRPSELLVQAVFVYGTLMRGECRFPIIDSAGSLQCALLADAPGRLFNLGSFPAMTAPSGPNEHVLGEFFRVADIASLIRELDIIEGFDALGSRRNFYERRLISAHVGDGRIRLAWTYAMDTRPVGSEPIESCDWRAHNGTSKRFIERLVQEHSRSDEEGFVHALTSRGVWTMSPDRETLVRRLLPLCEALMKGMVSERKMAQQSGNWRAAAQA